MICGAFGPGLVPEPQPIRLPSQGSYTAETCGFAGCATQITSTSSGWHTQHQLAAVAPKQLGPLRNWPTAGLWRRLTFTDVGLLAFQGPVLATTCNDGASLSFRRVRISRESPCSHRHDFRRRIRPQTLASLTISLCSGY